ncbi:MAG: glycerophosphodiester phosphodiesterase [Chloroflexi bacterium]|nr:glycerophosphodiester phosphodiesterase [Chloroflexota bacterium]
MNEAAARRERPNALRRPEEYTHVMGHRGAPGSYGIPGSRATRTAAPEDEAARYAPENTMVSFERAVAMGASIVELDVHLSADGHVVAIHDDTVDRTTDGTGEVGALRLAELQALDAGAWYGPAFTGQRIPTLDEVLAWARGKVRVAIELKQARRPQPGLEAQVVELVARHGMVDQVIAISFDHPMVARVKALNAAVPAGILYACRPVDPVALARQAQADVLLPQWSFVDAEQVAAAHAAGLAVAPWVTSDPAVWQWLLSLGVDAIGTNHPDRLVAFTAGR